MDGTLVNVWDVGGQDKLRPLWRSYTRCTDGIIFVVDSCREDRLEEAKLELAKFCKSGSNSKSSAIPVLVFANKQDLPNALDSDKLETLLGLKDFGANVPWFLQPTCAVTGEGLEDGLHMLQEMILRRRKKGKKNTTNTPLTPTSTAGKKLQRSHSHL